MKYQPHFTVRWLFLIQYYGNNNNTSLHTSVDNFSLFNLRKMYEVTKESASRWQKIKEIIRKTNKKKAISVEIAYFPKSTTKSKSILTITPVNSREYEN